MKHLLLLAVLALLAACGEGSSSVQVAAPQAARSTVIAFMGDSITAKWAPFMPTSESYTTVNLGISGDTTAMMLARFQREVIDAEPQVGIVVIDGGINDWLHESTGGPVSVANIKAMAAMATAAGIKVIIASLMLESDQPPSFDSIDAFNDDLVALCASEGYLYADYRDVMLNADGTPDLALYVDGLHPNQTGFARMWTVVFPLVGEDLR